MSRSHLAPEIADWVDEPLPPDEFERRVGAPLTEAEVEETAELVRWFMRRYPTLKERLAYARALFDQWTRPVRIVERS